MKQLVVISGKGGTGKTSIVASFAALANGPVIADCDVDAADLHLVLKPEPGSTLREKFTSGYEAVIDKASCIGCGACIGVCRFDALEMVVSDTGGEVARVIPYACEGCGACAEVCPVDAVTLNDRISGELLMSATRFGSLIHARLAIGQGASGKLVSMVRARAKEAAIRDGRELILIDGSPGIGCPVIASLTGADAAIIVTEPSVSALHDLKRIAELCSHFDIPSGVIINKHDIHEGMTAQIEEECAEAGLIVIGKLPFDRVFVDAMLAGVPVVEYTEVEITGLIKHLWQECLSLSP